MKGLILGFMLVVLYTAAYAQLEVTALDLSGKKITVFPNDSLLAFENLETLNLRGSGLDSLGEITCCKNLKVLNLSNNNLLDVSALVALEELREVDLSSNTLDHLPDENPFGDSLVSLDLHSNKLEYLPDYLFTYPDLSKIDLRGKQLYNYNKRGLKTAFGEGVKVLKSPNCQCD